MSRQTKAKRESLALFWRGAPAAQRYTGSLELYLCPICGTAFTQSALFTDDPELTREHAPPESVGGKVIALTCKSCNNEAGHSVDANVSRRAKQIHCGEIIAHAADGEGGLVKLQIGGERVNGRVSRDINGATEFEIIEQNDPRVLKPTVCPSFDPCCIS